MSECWAAGDTGSGSDGGIQSSKLLEKLTEDRKGGMEGTGEEQKTGAHSSKNAGTRKVGKEDDDDASKEREEEEEEEWRGVVEQAGGWTDGSVMERG